MKLLDLAGTQCGIDVYYVERGDNHGIVCFEETALCDKELLPFKVLLLYVDKVYHDVSKASLEEFFEEKLAPYANDEAMDMIADADYNPDVNRINAFGGTIYVEDKENLHAEFTFGGRQIFDMLIPVNKLKSNGHLGPISRYTL